MYFYFLSMKKNSEKIRAAAAVSLADLDKEH